MPNEIEFNRNFIALNWDNRELIDFTLLHEMIHLYQDAILASSMKTSKPRMAAAFARKPTGSALPAKAA